MSADSQSTTAVCASCGQHLAGRFCSDCGEERFDLHTLTVRHFLTHLLHEVFEFDGKIWRTLRALLCHPGFLSSEYCAGRRRLYVTPIRLLVTAAIVYALATRGGVQVGMAVGPVVLNLAPAAVREDTSIAETVKRIDRLHLLRGLLAEREKGGALESEPARERFHQRLEKFAEPLSFANVLLLAAAFQLLFGRWRKHFAEHSIFSMHFMSFVLFTSILFVLIQPLHRAGWGAAVRPFVTAIIVWQFVYLVLAIRRFYFGPGVKGRRPKLAAGFGAVAAYFLNSAFLTVVQTVGAALALWMAGSA